MIKNRIFALLITGTALLFCISGCGSEKEMPEPEEKAAAAAAPAAEEVPVSTPEPTPEPTPEIFPEKQFTFQDIVLTLDEGFANAGTVQFSAINEVKDEDSRTLRKKGFGTLAMQYQRIGDYDLQEALKSSDPPLNVLENDTVGTIVWSSTVAGDDVHYTVHFLVGEAHYQLDLNNDDSMKGRDDELQTWLTELLSSLDLTEKAKAAAAQEETPEPEETPQEVQAARITGIHAAGGSFEDPACLWMGNDLYEYGYPETAPEREPGGPIRVLLADYSSCVIIDDVGETDISDPMPYSSYILSRFNNILRSCISGEEQVSRIVFTTDPSQADVFLSIRATYPYAGTYSGGVRVYNCHVDVQIRQAGTDRIEDFDYDHEARDSITVRAGAEEVWMNEPSGFENEVGQRILEWYEDEQNGEP